MVDSTLPALKPASLWNTYQPTYKKKFFLEVFQLIYTYKFSLLFLMFDKWNLNNNKINLL